MSKSLLDNIEIGKLLISGVAVCVDPTGIAAATLGADAIIQARDSLFKNNDDLAALAKAIDKDVKARLKTAAYDKPTDARKILPDMMRIAFAQSSAFVEHDLDDTAILKSLTDRFQASDADAEHKLPAMISAFKKLYGPILKTVCNDPKLKNALGPALHRQDAKRQKAQQATLDQLVNETRNNPRLSLEARELARQEKLIEKIATKHLKNSPEDPLTALNEIGRALENYAAEIKRSNAGSNFPDSIQDSLDASHAFALKGETEKARITIQSAEDAIADQEEQLKAAKHRLFERRALLAALDGEPKVAAQIEIERLSIDAPVDVPVHAMVSRAIVLEEEFNRYGNYFHGLTAKALLEIAFAKAMPEDEPDVVLGQLANATFSLGQRANDPNFLIEAIELFRQHKGMVPKTLFPKIWAAAQNNLGAALRNQGTRTDGPKGAELLAQAVAAYRAALEVYTRADHSVRWAATQNNLAVALQHQGTRTDGPKGAELLAQAVAAYRAALEVRTRADHPVDWAMTQNNLGNCLGDQGTRTDGPKGADLKAQAVAAFRAALAVYTRADHPVQWATAQKNIAIALLARAQRADAQHPRDDLAAALAAIDGALEVYDPEHMSYEHGSATRVRAAIRSALDALGDEATGA